MTRLFISIIFCVTINFCFGQTQAEMNQNANIGFQKADKELNLVYQSILKSYKSDTEFVKNLKISQRIWIQLRDAEMKTKFPDRKSGYYGSAQPMCLSIYMEDLTEERTKKLKVWLTGIEEGDVCSGSVKMKQ